jgi:hypothetical protein
MFKKSKISKNKINSIKLDEEDKDINLHDDINIEICDKNDKINESDKDKDKSILDQNLSEKTLHINQSNIDIDKIKSEIDKKYKKSHKGISVRSFEKEDKIILQFKKDDKKESTVKKNFVSEILLKEAKNPDEKQKLLGIKREEVDRIKEEKKKGLIEMHKELFSLPKFLEAQPMTKSDHVDNLLKLSTAGLIEVPLPLEQKMKTNEETDNNDKKEVIVFDHKLAEELDYLKVLKKIGPSYAKGYKNDLSHKKIIKLNNVFENVFGENSRKKKLMREKIIMENRKMEGNM